MAGQCRVDGDLCGFAVADFTDHNDIRILRTNARIAVAKVSPIAGLTCDWLTPGISYSTGSSM